MNRKSILEIVFKAVVIAGLIVVIALLFDKKDSIVYVDSVQLMAKYKGMESVRKNLNSKSQIIQSKLDTLRNEVQEAIATIDKLRETANLGNLREMEKLATIKQQNYINYEQAVKEQFQKEEDALSGQLLNKINDYLKRYGKEKGYAIILAASPYGNIAYAEEAKNITNEVLLGLNAEFEKIK
jgi:outer membrane protein